MNLKVAFINIWKLSTTHAREHSENLILNMLPNSFFVRMHTTMYVNSGMAHFPFKFTFLTFITRELHPDSEYPSGF